MYQRTNRRENQSRIKLACKKKSENKAKNPNEQLNCSKCIRAAAVFFQNVTVKKPFGAGIVSKKLFNGVLGKYIFYVFKMLGNSRKPSAHIANLPVLTELFSYFCNALHRTRLCASTAADTLPRVNDSMICVHSNRADRTFFSADAAADTAVFARCAGDFSGVGRRTANNEFLALSYQRNELVRTDLNALSTGSAKLGVYNGNSVFYTDCVIFADFNAVSESMTARRALSFSVVEFLNGGAASRANINEFVLGRCAISVARYIGVFAFLHLRRNAHYFTQGYCYGRTAGLT